MSSASNLAVPMVLWGRHAPTHCISAILMTPDMKNIITGCNDGQICIWDLNENWQLYPRSMLFGHTTAISCLALGSDNPQTSYVVSSSENGEMCLWDITDGRCIEHTKMAIVHTDINAYRFRSSKELRLVCNGYYPEIHVIDPLTFEILWSLCSKLAPDWISACCVLRPVKREDDVVLAVSNSGTVKVWILTSEPKTKHIYEDESKQIRCLNAQTLTCCPYNQRTVLIVCSKYWQVYNYNPQSESPRHHGNRIYDAGDFTLLCSESNRVGERWAGGDFISVDRVIVWSNDGKGYLYKLPTNLLKGKAISSLRSRRASISTDDVATTKLEFVGQRRATICTDETTTSRPNLVGQRRATISTDFLRTSRPKLFGQRRASISTDETTTKRPNLVGLVQQNVTYCCTFDLC